MNDRGAEDVESPAVAETVEARRSSKDILPPRVLVRGTILNGRFEIDRALGSGGMGTVYVARDATLGREVAIKLHHAAGGAVRLQREAIAMARLAHPNVVTVFEVGLHDERPFVVMEYVPGQTLRAWAQAAKRSVDEILGKLVAAGEGLAAAHDAGLIHRDFKPENVLIGSDGRARVGDFGLARGADSQDPEAQTPQPSSADALLSPMTQTGAVLGTPAYMAPEQFAGEAIDARADQFAFCITAWEALWGERPFAGNNFGELQAAIAANQRRPPPPAPRVAAGVRAVLERGLAIEPGKRFADMHALLAALRRAMQRRQKWIAIATIVVLAGGGGLAVGKLVHGAAPSCDEPVAELPRDLASKVKQRGAVEAATQIERAIEHQSREHRNLRRFACKQARIDHQWSPDLEAKADACLDVQIAATRRILDDLQGEPDAAQVVLRSYALPWLAPCGDVAYLATQQPPPASPVEREQLVSARAEISAALGMINYDGLAARRARITRIVALPASKDPYVTAGLALLRGELASDNGQPGEAVKQITDAYYAARAIDDFEIATAAEISLLTGAATQRLTGFDARAWSRTAISDAERGEKRMPWLSANLYMAAARFADSQGDEAAALSLLERARPLLKPDAPQQAELASIEGGIKLAIGKIDEGVALYDKAAQRYTYLLGPKHPQIGSLLSDEAAQLLEAGREQQALALAQRALAIVEDSEAPGDLLDGARVNLAAVLLQAEKDDQAEKLFAAARADYVRVHGEHSAQVANIDQNLALIASDRGDPAHAQELLGRAIASEEQAGGKDSIELASMLYNLAAVDTKLAKHGDALAAIQRALAIYEAKQPGTARHVTTLVMTASIENDLGDGAAALHYLDALPAGDVDPQSRAWSQLERGRALIAVHRTADAAPLLAEARATYAGLGMTARVEQIDRLLRK